ncbi:MAG: acyl-CoA thioesterase [Deltaproteobacteria bacterium]|nr:MAG: acyl-CoA thioesterase [Deltaproteobacteria bacterium]
MKNIVERRIMWGDLDSLGIVFYPRYYEWIDASGHLYFDAINLNLGKLMKERAIQFGLIETGCRYRAPGRYYDKIKIITELQSLKKKTLELRHNIVRSSDDTLLVEGFEKRICLDVSNPDHFRAVAIPDDIYTVLERAKK